MLNKIVFGGQTGVDRAALDVAHQIGLSYGGWCPKGRLAEDGIIPPQYILVETDSSEYEVRTKCNVMDSDGTLILTHGAPIRGTLLTIEEAGRLRKPCLVVDLSYEIDLSSIRNWIIDSKISVLNIGGPRESQVSGGIYTQAHSVLLAVFRMFAD